MCSSRYHLAQVNIARMLKPLDSPVMAGFVSQLPVLNALADGSPGFVWRLAGPEGDATAVRAYNDPLILFNLSVWESLEALKAFTYNSGHLAAFRARAQWFERPTRAHMALWWVPVGPLAGRGGGCRAARVPAGTWRYASGVLVCATIPQTRRTIRGPGRGAPQSGPEGRCYGAFGASSVANRNSASKRDVLLLNFQMCRLE